MLSVALPPRADKTTRADNTHCNNGTTHVLTCMLIAYTLGLMMLTMTVDKKYLPIILCGEGSQDISPNPSKPPSEVYAL